MELGTKVKCNGYLKKVNVKYVYPSNTKSILIQNKKYNDDEIDFIIECQSEFLFLDKYDDGEIFQDTKKYYEKEFVGIVVAKKQVSTSNSYEFPYIQFKEDWEYSQVQVRKDKYIECYQVFYAMGKSRLVPIDKCDVIE